MRTEALRIVETAAEQLEGRAFKGYYVERKLVGVEQGTRHPQYCAAILLPQSEDELARDLTHLADQLRAKCPGVGPSFEVGPPPCILAQLNSAPLGCYWFIIRSVLLDSDRVVFDLQQIRYFPNKIFSASKTSTRSSGTNSDSNVDFTIPKINAEFVVNIIRFIMVVFVASVVGAFKAIEFLGTFTLRFMHESAFFIEKSAPMFYSGLNFLGRFVSAVLAFFTMIIRGNQPIRVRNFTPIEYTENNPYRRNSHRGRHSFD